jgi:hypothetical protein
MRDSPRKRRFAPVRDPLIGLSRLSCLSLLGSERGRLRAKQRIKDGRHVGLDFYDLLIEAG